MLWETNVASSAVAETMDAKIFKIGISEPPSDMMNMFPYNSYDARAKTMR